MHRLGVYRIRLQKKQKYKPPRSRSLRWAVTEGDGRYHSICFKDADTSDSICQRILVDLAKITNVPQYFAHISLEKSTMKKSHNA